MSCNPSNPEGGTHHRGCACHEAARQRALDELAASYATTRLRAERAEASNDTLAASVREHRKALVGLVDAAGGGPSGRRSSPGDLGDALDLARKVLGR